jgi:hypothetical protein
MHPGQAAGSADYPGLAHLHERSPRGPDKVTAGAAIPALSPPPLHLLPEPAVEAHPEGERGDPLRCIAGAPEERPPLGSDLLPCRPAMTYQYRHNAGSERGDSHPGTILVRLSPYSPKFNFRFCIKCSPPLALSVNSLLGRNSLYHRWLRPHQFPDNTEFENHRRMDLFLMNTSYSPNIRY